MLPNKKCVSTTDKTELLLQFAAILIFKILRKPFQDSVVSANTLVGLFFKRNAY